MSSAAGAQESFEAMQRAPVHPRNPELTPVAVLPGAARLLDPPAPYPPASAAGLPPPLRPASAPCLCAPPLRFAPDTGRRLPACCQARLEPCSSHGMARLPALLAMPRRSLGEACAAARCAHAGKPGCAVTRCGPPRARSAPGRGARRVQLCAGHLRQRPHGGPRALESHAHGAAPAHRRRAPRAACTHSAPAGSSGGLPVRGGRLDAAP